MKIEMTVLTKALKRLCRTSVEIPASGPIETWLAADVEALLRAMRRELDPGTSVYAPLPRLAYASSPSGVQLSVGAANGLVGCTDDLPFDRDVINVVIWGMDL